MWRSHYGTIRKSGTEFTSWKRKSWNVYGKVPARCVSNQSLSNDVANNRLSCKEISNGRNWARCSRICIFSSFFPIIENRCSYSSETNMDWYLIWSVWQLRSSYTRHTNYVIVEILRNKSFDINQRGYQEMVSKENTQEGNKPGNYERTKLIPLW